MMVYLCRRLCGLFVVLLAIVANSNAQVIDVSSKPPKEDTAALLLPRDKLVTVSHIVISGNKKTRNYIILREVTFKKGEQYLYGELLDKITFSRQQLMNTALFVDVDVTPVKVDSTTILIDIHVKERWYLFPIPYFRIVTRNFNTWWVEDKRNLNRVEYGLKFMQNNVSGRRDNLNLWVIGGFTQQFSLRYENPNIDNTLKNGINVGIGFRRNREMNYGMDSVNPNKISFVKQEDRFIYNQHYADLAYTYRPAIKTRHTFRTSYNKITVDDLILKLNPRYLPNKTNSVRFFDLSYNLSYINIDYIPYPLKGFMGDANLYTRFGDGTHYTQLYAKGSYNAALSPKTYLQLQAAGLIRFPFNQPYISNGLMGSTEFYMRGLEYYVIEGVAGGVGRATLKNRIVSLNVSNPFNIKGHHKIPFRVFAKAYGDLGYSYTPNYGISKLNNKLLRTWGVGIDIATFYDVVLRFEYSFNQLGDRGLFFHSQNEW